MELLLEIDFIIFIEDHAHSLFCKKLMKRRGAGGRTKKKKERRLDLMDEKEIKDFG